MANEITLPVAGMSCASCVARIEKSLNTIPGVIDTSVNLASETATVNSEQSVDLASLTQAVEKAGYQVKQNNFTLVIANMSCASCVNRVEKALQKVTGVTQVTVNLASEQAHVRAIANIQPETLLVAVKKAGYEASILQQNEPTIDSVNENQADWWPVLIAALLSFPLILPMLVMPLGIKWEIPGLIQLALATPVQFWLGARFYSAGWKALKAGTGNMDLLVALGTSAAYGLSFYHLFHSNPEQATPLYFEASAVIITLILFGKWLEKRAKNKTSEAIRALNKLRPDKVRLFHNNQETIIPIAQVQVGDTVIIRPGERIPIDGEIVEGESNIDESLLTGESLPIHKTHADKVTGGSINVDGRLVVKTTAIGAETMLSRIIKMVETAQSTKAPVQRLVDKVSTIFVPIVLLIALLTFLAWGVISGHWDEAILNAVSVMVIACPCALGLATPAAIMAGTGVAARYGILIKDGESLEVAHKINHIVFDKTGTLTVGKPSLTNIIANDNSNKQDLLQIAASIQHHSEHPLAQAVLHEAQSKNIEVINTDKVKTLPGKGLQADINGITYYIGSDRLMRELKVDIADLQIQAKKHEEQGHTVSWIAQQNNNKVLGMLAFGDTIKANAAETIAELHRQQIQTTMLTGDNLGSAKLVANTVNIPNFTANMLPADKTQAILELRQSGAIVAMVGDGINDAPALAAADIGIAMSSGTDVAMHAAGITLMHANPLLIVDALTISRRTYNKIKQNLFWAFIYNLVGIPLAMVGLLNPMIAGAAMAFSSVSVISNALLLQRWQATSINKS